MVESDNLDKNKSKIYDKSKTYVMDYKIHIIVLFIVIISMAIGTIKIPLTNTIYILVLPLIYALIISLILFLTKPIKFIGEKQSKVAESLMVLFISVLIAKLAVTSGQYISTIIQMGPALIFNLIGCFGALIALPIALILGFNRESIGMSTSICRDPSISMIMERYGFKSPETHGVLIVYIIGSIIGTIFISLLTSVCVNIIPFHPYAYAIACGVGSASMNVAGVAPLMEIFPNIASNLEAFSACSNLLTTCIGIYIMFITIPIAEKLYSFLQPLIGRNKVKYDVYAIENKIENEQDKSVDIFPKKGEFNLSNISRVIILLLIFAVIVTIGGCVALLKTGSFVNLHQFFINGIIGIILLSIIAVIGMTIKRFINLNIPSIVYISLIGMFLAFPGVPTSNLLNYFASYVDLGVICAAFLAYVGIAIGRDWDKFNNVILEGSIVTMVVIGATFLVSLFVAQWALAFTGMI
ncbi:MAG: DUF3100 domain-containing protein [Methanobacteriaceae archaeon]|nr:DUF3100 domain-containing protein [Methanobacteriaceae archaeon]